MSEILQREIEIKDTSQREDNKLVLSVASSYPYERDSQKRGRYSEVLEISEDAIDFVRLVDNRCPLLLNHDTERQIGVVERAWIEDEKLQVEVKFSDGGFAQTILNDVKNGIRRNTSIGYEINEAVWTEGMPPTLIAKRWTPLEVSVVPIPADPTVGYQRSLDIDKEEDMKKEEDSPKEEETANEEQKPVEEKAACPECGEDPCTCEEKKKAEETPAEPKKAEEEKACDEEEEDKCDDAEEIRSLGALTNNCELAAEFIKQKRTLSEFKEELTKSVKLNNNKEERKMQKFSIRKALLNATGRLSNEEAAYERQVIEDNKRKYNVSDADIVLSNTEIRAFDGTEATNQTVYQPGLYTPILRPAVTVDAIGTKKVAVNGQSISFAVCTSGLNAGFVDINGNVPSATMDFALKTMTPKKEGAYVDISYQSLLQDDPSSESIIMDDIVKALDQAKDAAFFNGTSGNNEPIGLLNVEGTNEVSISGTISLSTALEFEKKIRESYDYSPDLKWVFSTDEYYKWAATPYSAVEQNRMLLDPDTRKCIGYDCYMDASLPSGTVILGNFNEALEADFDGIVIRIVEDATLARKQALEIVAHKAVDFLCRRPKSFSIGV